jgi:putative transposase
MVSVEARRGGVAFATGRGLSQRRATTLLHVARSALAYKSRKTEKDATVIARMQALAARYPRFGYRRIRIYLERDGHKLNRKRMYRLWRAAKLQLPKKRPRKRVHATARDVVERPAIANEVWSYDFVFDHAANGQTIKCLTVVDEGTHECLAIDVAGAIRSRRVIEVLSCLLAERGAGAAVVDRGAGHPHASDRSRQALAERHLRELQRQVPRRVPQRRVVPLARRSPRADRAMAAALQRGPSPFVHRQHDALAVRGKTHSRHDRTASASAEPAARNGPVCCGI